MEEMRKYTSNPKLGEIEATIEQAKEKSADKNKKSEKKG
jgi:hypothetical protein